MTQSPLQFEGDSAAQVVTRYYEHAYDQGWTDGLPDPRHSRERSALRGRLGPCR
ncbi:MAG: hypothetical protein HYY79_04030 [Betaproteobacteria bacterium]|nr:hypothetical protein [Betaproteobacteria bacterium]